MYTTNKLYIALFFTQIKNENCYIFEPDFEYEFAKQVAVVIKQKNYFVDLFTGEKYKEISSNNWGKDKKRIYKTIPLKTLYPCKEIQENILKAVLENINDEYQEYTNPFKLYSINQYENFVMEQTIDPVLKVIKEEKPRALCKIIDINKAKKETK